MGCLSLCRQGKQSHKFSRSFAGLFDPGWNTTTILSNWGTDQHWSGTMQEFYCCKKGYREKKRESPWEDVNIQNIFVIKRVTSVIVHYQITVRWYLSYSNLNMDLLSFKWLEKVFFCGVQPDMQVSCDCNVVDMQQHYLFTSPNQLTKVNNCTTNTRTRVVRLLCVRPLQACGIHRRPTRYN